MHIDITEKKLAAETLAESLAEERDRLAAVLESLPVGVWIAAQDGRLIAKNRQADLIWHGDAPLGAGIGGYTEYAAWDARTGKQLLPEEYPMAQALRSGEAQAPCELRIRRFDGSEGTVLGSAVPLHDRQGHAAGVVGINVDISERKQAEDALRASEAALMQSQAEAHVGHWQWDLTHEGTVGTAAWSDELKRILGVEPALFKDNLAELFRCVVHPHDQARLWEERSHLLHDPQPARTEFRVIKPDGSVRYLWAVSHERHLRCCR